jgi:hypothetical protein
LKSKVVTGRNPFKCDEEINYELDSEESAAEAQGEDLVSKQDGQDQDEDDEEMLSGTDENGFLVSDGHLSDEEYNFSCEGAELDKKAEIELRRARFKENQK